MKLSQALYEAGVSLGAFTLEKADAVLIIGTQIGRDAPLLLENIVGSGLPCYTLSTMEETLLGSFYKYEVGTEEGVLGILTKALCSEEDPAFADFFDGLDEGYLSAECNLGEEEALELAQALKGKRVTCVLGADLEHHAQAKTLAQWLALLGRVAQVEYVMAGHNERAATPVAFTFPTPPESLESYDGTVAYACPARKKEETTALVGSLQFSIAAKIKNGDVVEISNSLGEQVRTFCLDEAMKGTVALLPYEKVPCGFRYVQSTIKKVG